MAKEKKKNALNLVETKGEFEIRGVIEGVKSKNFFKEISLDNGKAMRFVNCGVIYNGNDSKLFIDLTGYERDEVFISKKGEKGSAKKILWSKRNDYDPDEYNLIGMRLGLVKSRNAKGEETESNDTKTLVEFDACKYLQEHLVDKMSVYLRGKIDYSSYKGQDGSTKRRVKLVPNSIYLTSVPINFKEEGFEEKNNFTQTIVFMGIEQEKEDDKPTGRFVVSAKIVGYSSIEDAEFIIDENHKKLANQFKKFLKPYNAINVWGKIVAVQITEEVEEDCDDWGDENIMTKAKAPYKVEYVITGAKGGEAIDKDTFTEKNINDALKMLENKNKAKKDFSGELNDSWGSLPDSLDDGSEDSGWDD